MEAPNIEQVFDADLFVEQDVKAPGTENVTAQVKNESGKEVNWINIYNSGENIL